MKFKISGLKDIWKQIYESLKDNAKKLQNNP